MTSEVTSVKVGKKTFEIDENTCTDMKQVDAKLQTIAAIKREIKGPKQIHDAGRNAIKKSNDSIDRYYNEIAEEKGTGQLTLDDVEPQE